MVNRCVLHYPFCHICLGDVCYCLCLLQYQYNMLNEDGLNAAYFSGSTRANSCSPQLTYIGGSGNSLVIVTPYRVYLALRTAQLSTLIAMVCAGLKTKLLPHNMPKIHICLLFKNILDSSGHFYGLLYLLFRWVAFGSSFLNYCLGMRLLLQSFQPLYH